MSAPTTEQIVKAVLETHAGAYHVLAPTQEVARAKVIESAVRAVDALFPKAAEIALAGYWLITRQTGGGEETSVGRISPCEILTLSPRCAILFAMMITEAEYERWHGKGT